LESDASRGKRPARYPFVAKVKGTDLASGTQFHGITTDLSEGGCCVVTREPFSRGTQILLEITKGRIALATRATVAYCLEGKGMGIVFRDMPSDQITVLVSWLKETIPTMRRNARDEKTAT
jgi:hypothetical protein